MNLTRSWDKKRGGDATGGSGRRSEAPGPRKWGQSLTAPKSIGGGSMAIARRFWASFLVLAGLLLSAGCTASIDLSGIKSVPESEGVAFGRIKVVRGGEEENLTGFLGEKPWSIIILPDGSSNAIDYNLSGDGSFFWHLRPGGYTIADFQGYGLSGRLFTHLNVVGNTATYVGTLTLYMDRSRYRMSVEDDYEHAAKGLSVRFPEIKMDVRKELMVMERRR